MEISVRQSNQLKSIAILMMLCLHLFNRDYKGLFQPILFIGKQPMTYYISLFCDACVPIFAFVSGYGLYYKFQQNKIVYTRENFVRLRKLYINYWIIILIFPVILGLILKHPGYPGTFFNIFLNLTGLDPTYNGAWWFFTIYIFFVCTSRFWFYIISRANPILSLLILFVLYFIGFYFRIYRTDIFSNPLLDWLQTYTALYFCTLFQFMLGAFALKYNWNSYVSKCFTNLEYKNFIIFLIIFSLIVFHAIIPNFIIAPFTAIIFIFLYCQLDLSEKTQKLIDFFTPHSTNIWLIHMFFYLIFFPEFIYSFRYPVVIFFILVVICIFCSYGINFINKKTKKII